MNEDLWMGLNRRRDPAVDPDVVVVGIPYDGSVAHDPGAAEAPKVLRELSRCAPSRTERGIAFGDLRIIDAGDVRADPVDDEATQRAIEAFVRDAAASPTATLLSLGGDHSVTSAVLRGLAPKGPVGVLWFDAHPDLMDTFGALRGKRESRWNHACPLRRILEMDCVADEDVLLIGTRDELPEETAFVEERGLQTIPAHELVQTPAEDLARRILDALRNTDSLYVSIDIDVLDPAFAPGTGVPIPGGMTTRHLLDTIQILTNAVLADAAPVLPPLLGVDLVEISPPADVNRITSRAGVSILGNVLALIAAQRGRARRDT